MPLDFTLGRYYHGNSLVHRLDPRTKLLALISLIVSVSLTKNPSGFLFTASFLAIALLLSRLPFHLILRVLRQMSWLFVSIMLLHIIFSGRETRFIIFPGSLEDLWAGLYSGAIVGCRFLLIILGAGILTLTTIPIRLADALAVILNPLGRIGIPIHQIPVMTVIVLHFIPLLFEEAEKLISVQKIRGASLEGQNLPKRLYNLAPILAPLLKSSFRKADELAIGMESRCYSGEKRNHLYPLKFNKADVVSLITAIVIAAITAGANRLM